ncbi:cupredoxin domain-containing protein [Oceanobacillus profundus]|uniref:cupredoxin domain-containing protein n=1 Tax=Oceanobacillus TaxID=182709 RepID=UPI0026E1C3E2|nr:cupredoxin domain-containing protein [Oceanobacillus profundus]MDO6451419.1 cupredoxin domain-containing protein [Oceanobacillus profundus]
MKKGLLSILFIGLLFSLVACGGDENGSASEEADNTKTTAEQSNETSASDESVEVTNEVNIVATDFEFNQDKFVVQSGEEVTITLTNEEGHHGIAINELGVKIEGDGEAVIIPEDPGEYEIYCNIFCGEGHAEMVATLVVL